MLNILNCILVEPYSFAVAPYKYLQAYACKDEPIRGGTRFFYLDCTDLQSTERVYEYVTQHNIHLCCFSCITSARLLGLHIAKSLRDKGSQALMMFGGPGFGTAEYNRQLMSEFPQIDIIVRGEGEGAFREVVGRLVHDFRVEGLRGIDGIDCRIRGEIVSGADRKAIQPFDDIPFPYTDDDLKQHDRMIFTTKRGCKNDCYYCAWSFINKNSEVRMLSLNRIKSDLRRFFQAGVKYVMITDTNFTDSREQFIEILRFIREENRSTVLYSFIDPAWLDEEVVELMSVCNFYTDFYIQTLNPETARVSGREPYSMKSFISVIKLYKKYRIGGFDPEILLGLPGDNFESFKKTVVTILDLLVKYRVSFGRLIIDRLYVVPNCRFFNLKKEYGIKSLQDPSFYVCETATFPRSDMEKALDLRAAVNLSFNNHKERYRFIALVMKYRSAAFVLDRFVEWLKRSDFDLRAVTHYIADVPEVEEQFSFPLMRKDSLLLKKEDYDSFFSWLRA